MNEWSNIINADAALYGVTSMKMMKLHCAAFSIMSSPMIPMGDFGPKTKDNSLIFPFQTLISLSKQSTSVQTQGDTVASIM